MGWLSRCLLNYLEKVEVINFYFNLVTYESIIYSICSVYIFFDYSNFKRPQRYMALYMVYQMLSYCHMISTINLLGSKSDTMIAMLHIRELAQGCN